MKLDLYDRKILFELDRAARMTTKEIGKVIRKSKQFVDYRIKKLESVGILNGYMTVIDYARLGYQSVRVYFKFHNISPEEQEQLENDLIKDHEVWWLVTLEGVWDVGYALALKSMVDFYDYWDKLMSKYRKFVQKSSVVVYTHIKQYPKSYLIEKNNVDEGTEVGTTKEVINLDALDYEILKLISDNARMPLIEIAASVKKTPVAVRNRIKQLEKERVIQGYRALIDVRGLGYRYYKTYIDFIETTRIREFHQYCKEHPNMLNVNRTIGGKDFEIEMQARSFEEFDSIMKELRKSFPGMIDNYEFVISREEKKMVYFPF